MSKTKNRATLLVAAGIFLLLGAMQLSSASADTRKTTKKAKVYKRAGEASGVLAEVPPQRPVKVINEEGRWVKVRYRGITGWMTRTSLTATRSARATRDRRRPFVQGRAKQRGWASSAPEDRVGADAIDEDDVASGEADDDEADDEADEDDDGDDDKLASRDDEDDEGADDEEDEEDDEFIEEIEPVETAARSRRKRSKRNDDDFDTDDEDDDDGDDRREKSNTVTVVVREAEVKTKRKRRSETVVTVSEGDELVVMRKSKSGKWLYVRDSSGDEGWIKTRYVSQLGYEYPKTSYRLGARTGYAYQSQDFTTSDPAANERASYIITAPAVALMINAEVLYRYKPQYMLGLSGMYSGGLLSNIAYQGMLGTAEIAYATHDVEITGVAGYNLQNPQGMVFYGSAGVHYGFIQTPVPNDPAQLDMVNPIRIPSERVLGPTLGARFDMPYYSDKLGFSAELKAILALGSRTQTPGLTDGKPEGMRVYWLGANAIYRWKPSFDVEIGLRFKRASTAWSGPSDDGRDTGANAVDSTSARTDTSVLFTVGAGRSF